MRNLKRALSLALASVMLLGMMVVGTSAASYPDVDENDNVEAIEVLNAVNVMIGDRGNFRPDAKVNRHEMAVIMAKLVLGNDVADNYVGGALPFTDVFPWAEKYVAACYENGITKGTSGTTYGGNQPLTAVEAAGMMLNALGYKDLNKGADDWRAPLVAMANQLRLFNGVTSNPKEQLNRNQVAQLVLNTLKSPVVDLKDGTFNISDGNGQLIVTGGNREYIVRSSLDAYARAISDVEQRGNSASGVGGYTIELGEHLYNGDLELRDNATDDFERPSRTWVYNGKEIGTFAKDELLKASYTTGVSCRTLYDLLSRANLLDYDFEYYVDGVASSAGASDILTRSSDNFGATGKGVLTEVYVDNNARDSRGEITIVSIHTWLAQATADYSTNRETVNLKVYDGYSGSPAATTSTTKTVDVEDVPAIEGLKKDDFVLVNMTGKDRTKLEVIAVDDVEILSDSTLTRFSKDSDNDNLSDQNEALFDSLTTGGTKYDSSNCAFYSDEVLDLYNNKLLTGKTYNVYLDNYGYVIGVDLHTGEDSYVFITGYDLDTSAIASGTAKANAIFTDGTAKAIDVNVNDTNKNIKGITGYDATNTSNQTYFEDWAIATSMNGSQTHAINRWFTYTEDKGEYTLSPATRMFTTEYVDAGGSTPLVIKCNSVRLDENPAAQTATNQSMVPATKHTGANVLRAYGNDNSIFILADTGTVSTSGADKVITGVDGVYTGVQNVEIEVPGTTTANTAITGTKLHDSIYTLYDKNGYIIAAVILGDAKGGDANLVYVKTAATAEEKNGDDYYWEFDAIVDGEIETLTVKSKFKSTINNLKPGHVQEIRYDGEYVTSVVDVKTADIYVDYKNRIDDETVYDIGHKTNDKIDCWDTHTSDGRSSEATRLTYNGASGYKADDLRFDGRTLYLTSVGTAHADRDYGLTFAEGAKAVVHQKIGGKWKWQEYDSVAAAIDSLGDADNTDNGQLGFNGRLTAVLNSNGTAKWIVIHSDTDVETGSTTTPKNDGLPQSRENLTLTKKDMNTIETKGPANDPDAFAGIGPYLQEGLTYSYNEVTGVLKISGKITSAYDNTDSTTNVPGFGKPSDILSGKTSKYITFIPIPVGDDWFLWVVSSMTKANSSVAANYNGTNNKAFTISWDLDWSKYGKDDTELSQQP